MKDSAASTPKADCWPRTPPTIRAQQQRGAEHGRTGLTHLGRYRRRRHQHHTPDSHRITVLEHIPGDNYSLPVNSILSLYNDNYNNMWAGSIRKGLINIREVSMKTYTDVFPEAPKV